MASALEAVLNLKAQETARQQEQSNQISQAVAVLQQAKQQAVQNQLAQLQMKASLAEKGLVIDPNSPSGFKKDESLQDPLTKLLNAGKVAEAAKNLNLPDVFQKAQQSVQSLSGMPVSNATQPVNSSIPVVSDVNSLMNQKDVFGEYTPKAKIAQKLYEQDQSPLSGDTAPKFSGAKNGIENINQIIEKINSYSGDKKDLIYKANLQIEAENAKDYPLAVGVKSAYKSFKLSRTTPESQALANNFSTLAENILRARTGAAAPDPEIVREYGRTLLKTFLENPKVWNQKLKNEYDFLKSTHDEIRPLRKDDPTIQFKGGIKDNENSSVNISLPKEVKTTSQAVDYLVKNQNMSKEEAINWIRSQ